MKNSTQLWQIEDEHCIEFAKYWWSLRKKGVDHVTTHSNGTLYKIDNKFYLTKAN